MNNPQASGGGGWNGNYSYANPLGQQGQSQTPPVKNAVSGISSIADALINGYFKYMSQPASAPTPAAPMQLASAQYLAPMFGGSNAPAVNAPMPGGLY